jgi:hypothetical protein
MTKSKLYQDSKATGLAALYAAKTTRFNKRTNCIEYIYRYFSGRYAVKCVGINALGIAFRGACLTDGKHEGYFYFQHSDERVVKQVMTNPDLLYNSDFMTDREVILSL